MKNRRKDASGVLRAGEAGRDGGTKKEDQDKERRCGRRPGKRMFLSEMNAGNWHQMHL